MTTGVELDAKVQPAIQSEAPEKSEFASDISSSHGESTMESLVETSSSSCCECLCAPFLWIWNSLSCCFSGIFNALFCCCPKGEINLVEVWKETEAHIQKHYLDATKAAEKKTETYEAPTGSGLIGAFDTEIEIVNEHCLDRAINLRNAGHLVLVLNIADPTQPGRGYQEGAISQEAEIMRRSALSATRFSPIPPRGGIYTPAVPVFRHGPNEQYAFMDRPVYLDFVSVAPVVNPRLQADIQNQKMHLNPKDETTIRDKIRMQLEIGYRSGNKSLVLGAFGCAIFNNPAHEIARIYKELIEKEFAGCFRIISFCIPDGEKVSKLLNSNGILQPFKEAFKEANL